MRQKLDITLDLVHHLGNSGWRQICFYRYCELADYNHNNSWLPPTVTQPMNLTTFSWPSLPKSFNNSISLSRAFLPFSPEIARKPQKIKYTKKICMSRETQLFMWWTSTFASVVYWMLNYRRKLKCIWSA